jgi:membrane protein
VAAELFNLNGVSTKRIIRLVWAEIQADDVFGRSAQLAYYFFLALFPFLICVVASLSVFGSADSGRAVLFGFLARFLPRPAFQLVATTFGEIIQASGALKMSLGIVASLVSASFGMSALMSTLNAAYKVNETRSLVKQYAVAIGLTIGIVVLLVAALAAVVVGDKIAEDISSGPIAAILSRILQWPVAVAVLLLAFAVMYHFGPNLTDHKWHWVTPGALLGILLLLLMSLGLRVYLHYVGTYSVSYGSLGGVFILLLCFYLNGFAVLSGGALNGVLETLNRQKDSRKVRAGRG